MTPSRASRASFLAAALLIFVVPHLHATVMTWTAGGAAPATSYRLRLNGPNLELTDDATGTLLAKEAGIADH